MTWWQVMTLAVAFVGMAGVVATLILRTTARLDKRIDGVHEEATADRRAFRQAMELFRAEMQRLAERQARTEGWTERRAEAG